MPTYTLNNSATDIDSALQKVVSATTTPTDLSPLMVTSGGVKAYVDTQVDGLGVAALETKVDSLVGVSVSTCSLSIPSSGNYVDDVSFGSSNNISGVSGATHQLARLNTTTMKTPTGGVSIVSVNATITDIDRTGIEDNYVISLYTNGNLVAKTSTSSSEQYYTYAQLCYSSLMNQNNSITMSVELLSGPSYAFSVTGNITCVNYQ